MTEIDLIRNAIAGNPQCGAGILARQRVVVTDHGSLSHNNDKELFCLVRPRLGTRSWWYGHVLRCPNSEDGEPLWAAAIIRSEIYFDNPDAKSLFRFVYKALAEGQCYSPPYSQQNGDVFAMTGSFETAVGALERMIGVFQEKQRQETIIDDVTTTLPEGLQDTHCFEIYGLADAIFTEPYSPYEPTPSPELYVRDLPDKAH